MENGALQSKPVSLKVNRINALKIIATPDKKNPNRIIPVIPKRLKIKLSRNVHGSP